MSNIQNPLGILIVIVSELISVSVLRWTSRSVSMVCLYFCQLWGLFCMQILYICHHLCTLPGFLPVSVSKHHDSGRKEFTSSYSVKRSQGGFRAESWRQELKKRPWKKECCLLAGFVAHLQLLMQPSITCLGVPVHSALGPPHLFISDRENTRQT